MNVKITTANVDVIDSGLVTSFNDEPICILLPNTGKRSLKIVFEFFKDENNNEQKMEAQTPNDYEVVLKLTNFTNPLGTGTKKPISFASTSDGKNLYINFYVYVVGESSPTLHYTIYKER